MSELVTRRDDLAWGTAVFAGTRVPVETLFDYLASGMTVDDFVRQFPTVTRELAVAVLEDAKRRTVEEAGRVRPRGS